MVKLFILNVFEFACTETPHYITNRFVYCYIDRKMGRQSTHVLAMLRQNGLHI